MCVCVCEADCACLQEKDNGCLCGLMCMSVFWDQVCEFAMAVPRLMSLPEI